MGDRHNNHEEPEVFDRLQKLARHERRRRWDSTRLALAAGSDSDKGWSAAPPIPTELVSERFDSVELQLAALARELRRVERRASIIALRARIAVALGLVAAIACMGLWTGTLHDWIVGATG